MLWTNKNTRMAITISSCGMMLSTIVGCGVQNQTKVGTQGADVVRIMGKQYRATTQTVVLHTKQAGHQAVGEDIVDVHSPTGISNYIHAAYPHVAVKSVQLTGAATESMVFNSQTQSQVGKTGNWTGPGTALNQLGSAAYGTGTLPPGVQYDQSIRPLAGLSASTSAKAAAVIQIARSKLGTPYIWGHNEDRGQYGFDCSNFIAYVYHHALGYKFSGSSIVQNASVGWHKPVNSYNVGDLLIFENGGHVGIYAGNGKFIEEGGGLGKVGYLSLSPGNYWNGKITSVRRMF